MCDSMPKCPQTAVAEMKKGAKLLRGEGIRGMGGKRQAGLDKGTTVEESCLMSCLWDAE